MAKRKEFSQANYEDKFLDVMYYAKLKLDEQGLTYKVTDEGDLKRLLLWVDKHRKHKGQSHFDRDKFLPELLDSYPAQEAINGARIVGKPNTKAAGVTIFNKGFIGHMVRGAKTYLMLSSRKRDAERIPVLVEKRPVALTQKIEKYRGEGRGLYEIKSGDYNGGVAAYAVQRRKGKVIGKRLYNIANGRRLPKDTVLKEL